jgi:hypothetical protein
MKCLRVFSLLLVFLCVVTGGCRQGDDVTLVEKHLDSRYACSGDSITAECVVTCYAADGGKYFSEQVHRICPVDGSIEVSADEPQGRGVWLLRDGRFDVVVGKGRFGRTETVVCDREYAQVISAAMLAGSGMMDVSSQPAAMLVKIEGQWYEPIGLPSRSKDETATVTLYRNRDTGVIDVVGLDGLPGGQTLTAKSYNYQFSSQFGKRMPTKIDLFDGVRLSLTNRIFDIDYKEIAK